MTRTVVALFDDFSTANQSVRDLVDAGFMREDISLMASDAQGNYGRYLGDRDTVSGEMTPDAAASGASEGAGVGAGIGAVIGGLGGLLIGLGALTIPGIGPVLAAGPLSAALTGLAGAGVGAVAGGVTGGLLGALVDMGIPEETAGIYAEGVRRGGTLVTLRTSDEMTQKAVDILNRHRPVDINQRSAQWREGGWSGFDSTRTGGEYTPGDYSRTQHSTTPGMATGMTGQRTDADLSSTSLGSIGHNQENANWPNDAARDMEQRREHIESELHSSGVSSHDTLGDRTHYPQTGDLDAQGLGGHDREQKLWPREEHRESGQHTGQEVERDLWTEEDSLRHDEDVAFQDYSEFDHRFRTHFDTSYTGMGYSYDEYQPAYRYGYTLARDQRYHDYDWDRLEPEARRTWETEHPNSSWDRFKMSIRHAWEEIKDAVD